ncbi:MAG: FAD-binding dehydrogenase [Burkholderiales bacterium]|nr:FAD-binding dehydrogenase [Burkholderiales bacterium]
MAQANADVLVVGAGLAGLVTTLELLRAGRRVTLLDRKGHPQLGGLAHYAFGGMALVGTPEQRLSGVRDTPELALADWLSFANFGPDDVWPRQWAEHYVSRSVPEVHEWLKALGLRFMPAVQWVERGWLKPGNSVPRYHVLWGSSRHMSQTVVQAVQQAGHASGRLTILTAHRVDRLIQQGAGRVIGVAGVDEAQGRPFELHAPHTVVATGGITGSLDRVREHWPTEWGSAPEHLLNGSHPTADGRMHDEVSEAGGRVTHLDQMWHYVAGVRHPQPLFEGHGLSLVPPKSALWLDPDGRRIGPEPFITGFDTRVMVERVSQAGWPYTWQVLNRRIANKELAASGADHNPAIRDRKRLAFVKQLLCGQPALVDDLLQHCPDFVHADDLPTLVQRMNQVAGNQRLHAETVAQAIEPYDEQIRRGHRFHNDDQLRRIEQMRRWTGDRVRTCKDQPVIDPQAGPLIAIRCQILTRKSMGGIQTDLQSRVLSYGGDPITGLYAAGEASGFGGGGSNGEGSLEGTFLSGCILTGRAAARSIHALL